MDKASFLGFAHERYSYRKLMGALVAAEKLERILEAARIVSTAHNKQPFRVSLSESPEAVERVHEVTPYIFRADCFLMMTVVPGEAWVREFDQTSFVAVDASIVATHIMLAIGAEGLGMTWIGYFDASRTEELFPVMAPYELIASFPIGEKAAETHPTRLREKRKPTTGFVERFQQYGIPSRLPG